jgi:hypothetical protein
MKNNLLNVLFGVLTLSGAGVAAYSLYSYFQAKSVNTSYKAIASPSIENTQAKSSVQSTPSVVQTQLQVQGQTFGKTTKGEVSDTIKKIKELRVNLNRTIELSGELNLML